MGERDRKKDTLCSAFLSHPSSLPSSCSQHINNFFHADGEGISQTVIDALSQPLLQGCLLFSSTTSALIQTYKTINSTESSAEDSAAAQKPQVSCKSVLLLLISLLSLLSTSGPTWHVCLFLYQVITCSVYYHSEKEIKKQSSF